MERTPTRSAFRASTSPQGGGKSDQHLDNRDAGNLARREAGHGAVLVGDLRGKYEFGDQDRIKIQTPFATTVYQMKISGDRMTLQEPGGSTLEFTRIKQTDR